MSCYGCIFKGKYEDMGVSCDACKLQYYLYDAIKACDNSENCPHRVTLEEAKKKLLSSDVVEVRHGHWIDKSRNINGLYDPRFDCSVCGHIFWFQGAETFNYCPACGAKMDGKRSENGKS